MSTFTTVVVAEQKASFSGCISHSDGRNIDETID